MYVGKVISITFEVWCGEDVVFRTQNVLPSFSLLTALC